MSADRQFRLVSLLLERGRMTAGELAEQLGVSPRTVLRDVDALSAAGVEAPESAAPVIVRKGRNRDGKTVRFYLNYSPEEKAVPYRYGDGADLFTGEAVRGGDTLHIGPWDLKIVEA